jgi:hypothetical protein
MPHHGQKSITIIELPPSWTISPYSRDFGQ